MQYVLEDRINNKQPNKLICDEDEENSSIILSHMINLGLPERFQISDNEYVDKVIKYEHMTKRDLLKETHQAWKNQGVNIKRGASLPSINRIKRLLGWLIQNINNIDKIYEDTNEIMLVNEIYDQLIVSAPQFGVEISN